MADPRCEACGGYGWYRENDGHGGDQMIDCECAAPCAHRFVKPENLTAGKVAAVCADCGAVVAGLSFEVSGR